MAVAVRAGRPFLRERHPQVRPRAVLARKAQRALLDLFYFFSRGTKNKIAGAPSRGTSARGSRADDRYRELQ